MAEGTEKNEEVVQYEREEIFSKAVRAGKRTYFFDVKATKRNDYYLTLTESKKRFNRDGRFYFEKHKIFLYKEDFDKFSDGLRDAIEFIKEAKPELIPLEPTFTEATVNEEFVEEKPTEEVTAEVQESGEEEEKKMVESLTENFTDVEFEDLEDSNES
ncbi:MAG: PUR family DNA/RNA-binding protein [Bacteroidales bacterium]|nr:PUR family DNA/RNA-binding protein [Bacteroidales bacterium]